jgi:demethylmenaquinone methyltransferase/2-methoxy-6-polyprenyl-1,4-benzoquinol methylase
MQQSNIYDPVFVSSLFDEMSATYGLVNLVSSFGFCRRWRLQCIQQVQVFKGARVVDLMSGMGELCPAIATSVGSGGNVVAVDISPVMCSKARLCHVERLACPLEVIEADALCSSLPSESADVVLASFGLKTFSLDQISQLAKEVRRLLKPGGLFSLIEISVPPSALLRGPYMLYLKRGIPLIGRLLMGNPENYRLLGVYTEAFGSCHSVASAFRAVGLDVEVRSFFFGCATALVGRRTDERLLSSG